MTRSGSRKPGQTDSGSEIYKAPKTVNMGTDNDNQKNPLSMIVNAAKGVIGGGK